MRPRWRKVIHDLLDNKARTLLVVFSIAVGVFSIGVISGAYQIISSDMGVSYAANNPANIDLRTVNFNDDVLTNLRNMNGVKQAEGRRVINFRARTTDDDTWMSLPSRISNKMRSICWYPWKGPVKLEKMKS